MAQRIAGDLKLLTGVESEAREFAEQVQPHARLLVRLAARLAGAERADDVVQDALVRAWRHRGLYDTSRGPFVNWLLEIVANEARRAPNGKRVAAIRLGDESDTAPASDDRLDLEDAIGRLPPRKRLAVNWHYFAGLITGDSLYDYSGPR